MRFLFLSVLAWFVLSRAQEVTFTDAPRAASYGLFAVNTSGVNGNMQVSTEEGRVKIVVTIPSAQMGDTYTVAIFEGDCGPDRVMLTQLETVPSIEADPFSSITYTDIAFETLTEANNFAYIYSGPEINQANILACGEVGLGANTSNY